MCPSLFLEDGIDLARDEMLKLRYRLLIHKNEIDPSMVEEQYEDLRELC